MPLPRRSERSTPFFLRAFHLGPTPIRQLRQLVCAAFLASGPTLAWGADPADPPAPAAQRRPDAAEAVQEGNVEQWLEHYQRERGPEWERASAREATRPDRPATPPGGTRDDSSTRAQD